MVEIFASTNFRALRIYFRINTPKVLNAYDNFKKAVLISAQYQLAHNFDNFHFWDSVRKCEGKLVREKFLP